MEKVRIEKNTVQETLVIPLYGRKMCTERFPALFQDKKALELIGRLDYDFSALEKKAGSIGYQFGALEVAMRETDLMTEMKEYLDKLSKGGGGDSDPEPQPATLSKRKASRSPIRESTETGVSMSARYSRYTGMMPPLAARSLNSFSVSSFSMVVIFRLVEGCW